MTSQRSAAGSPLDPSDDFARDHSVIHLLLALESLGANVDRMAEESSRISTKSPDEFVYALAGLAEIRIRIRRLDESNA